MEENSSWPPISGFQKLSPTWKSDRLQFNFLGCFVKKVVRKYPHFLEFLLAKLSLFLCFPAVQNILTIIQNIFEQIVCKPLSASTASKSFQKFSSACLNQFFASLTVNLHFKMKQHSFVNYFGRFPAVLLYWNYIISQPEEIFNFQFVSCFCQEFSFVLIFSKVGEIQAEAAPSGINKLKLQEKTSNIFVIISTASDVVVKTVYGVFTPLHSKILFRSLIKLYSLFSWCSKGRFQIIKMEI